MTWKPIANNEIVLGITKNVLKIDFFKKNQRYLCHKNTTQNSKKYSNFETQNPQTWELLHNVKESNLL